MTMASKVSSCFDTHLEQLTCNEEGRSTSPSQQETSDGQEWSAPPYDLEIKWWTAYPVFCFQHLGDSGQNDCHHEYADGGLHSGNIACLKSDDGE